MTVTGDPFRQTPVDPPIPLNGRPGVPHVPPATTWPSRYEGQNPYPPTKQPHNTLAVLSPILAVVVPPAGAILGHLALAQIRRSGEAGRTAAIWGLILGYALTVALMAGLIVWAVSSPSRTSESVPMPGATFTASPLPRDLPPVVVTSVAPPPSRPRVKLDLATVTVGTCAEIQKRDVGDDALDLFGVPCEHRQGVYTVVARVDTDANCQSTYVAAPPDHSFALCLNEY
jgi:Domain of unknown function (DUF4190)